MDDKGNLHACCHLTLGLRGVERRMEAALREPDATIKSVRAAWLDSTSEHLGKNSLREIAGAIKRTFGDGSPERTER